MPVDDAAMREGLALLEQPVQFNDAEVAQLREKADALEQKRRELSIAEEDVTRLKAEVQALEQGVIPAIMAQLGVRSFSLTNGVTLRVDQQHFATWPTDEERRRRAVAWLEERNHADVISCKVEVAYPKGYNERARRLVDSLRGDNMAKVVAKEGVHPATLNALVRELIRRGESVDAELFGVYTLTEAKLEREGEKSPRRRR